MLLGVNRRATRGTAAASTAACTAATSAGASCCGDSRRRSVMWKMVDCLAAAPGKRGRGI